MPGAASDGPAGNQRRRWPALHIYGALLLGGRLLYAYGMLVPKSSANPPRQLGILTSWIVILAAGVQLLII